MFSKRLDLSNARHLQARYGQSRAWLRRHKLDDAVISPAEVAHHEAGHAVAAVYLNQPIIYVTIVPDDDSRGHVQYGNTPRSIQRAARDGDRENPRLIQWIERELITTLAGGFAQAKFNPNSDWRSGMGEIGGLACWGGSDIQNAIRLVDDMHGQGRVADAYYAYVKARALAFVEYQWPEIQRVAAALLERKTMTADEVRAVMFPEFSKVD